MTTILLIILAVAAIAKASEYWISRPVWVGGHLYQYPQLKVKPAGSFMIAALLTLFTGLRAGFNDTTNYRIGFNKLATGWEAITRQSFSLGDHPGFAIYQVALKTWISDNSQTLIFTSSLITIFCFIFFDQAWSRKFSLSAYLFITTGLLYFTMAAMKQVLAMSIGLCAIHCLLKRKTIPFLLLLLLAATFHPYVLLFGLGYFLKEKVWTQKVVLLLILATVSGIYMSQFLEIALTTIATVGKKYDLREFEGRGVNNLRFLVHCVTPAMSFMYRGAINKSRDTVTILCSNFSVVTLAFMVLALFGSANMFARMATYFLPFSNIATANIIVNYVPVKYRSPVFWGCVGGYFFFCMYLFATNSSYQYKSIFH
ncbi:MAG: EpsG family protein [Lentisphaeria bacterium]|nr:EpsG family protein [Lentisphaeria bacterium]